MIKNFNIGDVNIKNINDNIYISGQINLNMIYEFKKTGIDIIINNRPDNEEINQLKSIDIKQLTDSLNMEYYNIPFFGSNVQPDQISLLANILKSNNKRVLLFCKSGTRSALIWGLSSVGSDIKDVIKYISNMGYDSSIFPNMVEYFSNQ